MVVRNNAPLAPPVMLLIGVFFHLHSPPAAPQAMEQCPNLESMIGLARFGSRHDSQSSRGHCGQLRTPLRRPQQAGVFLIPPDGYIGWCSRSLPGAELEELSRAGVQLLSECGRGIP